MRVAFGPICRTRLAAGRDGTYVSAMPEATDPRQLAELCRRLANVPTSGGHRADRVLVALADKLDREAPSVERPAFEPPQRGPRKPRRQK